MKKITMNDLDDKIDKQGKDIEQQGKNIEQIMWLLKGSEALDIEGVIPCQKRIESQLGEVSKEVGELKEWKKTRWHVSVGSILKAAIWAIGFTGTVLGIIYSYQKIFGV